MDSTAHAGRRPAPSASTRLVVVGHLAVALAGAVAVGALVVRGTRPGVGLEGIFAGWGLLVAFPLVAFSVAAGMCAASLRDRPRRSARISLRLGVVEVAVALLLAGGVVVSVASYGEFAPWRSPLVGPSLVLAVVGGGALALGHGRSSPRPHA